jgi:hypothetical protein
VDGDDEGDARAERAAEGRAVEDVEAARAQRQTDRIPPDVSRGGGKPAGTAEGEPPDVDEALQLGEQALEVARRARARLRERRRVDAGVDQVSSS